QAALVGLGVFGAVFLMLLGAGRALNKLRGRLGRRHRPAVRSEQPESGLYHDLLAVLSLAGAPKPPWRPLRAHTREIAQAHPQLAAAAADVTDLYYRARFGARSLTEPEAMSARERIEAMLEMVREDRAAPHDPPTPAHQPT